MSTVNYNCTALHGSNKVGKLSPDAGGYYPMILGAFDVDNSAGEHYPFTQAKELFKASSSFMRRVANGQCRAELGHPKKLPGMSNQEYLQRILTIEETQVCAHFKSITIDTESVTDEYGKRIVAVMGMVKPSGPFKNVLQESLDNPDENVAFSIRSLTNNVIQGGKRHKHVKTVVGYDYVNEPGIQYANKFGSPALESYSEGGIFIPETLEALEHDNSRTPGSLENSGIDIRQLRSDLGWSKVIVTNPASLRW